MQEISTEAVQIAKQMLSINQRIKSKMYTREDNTGVLKRAYHLYTNCFSVKLSEINKLFDEDMADWKRELSASMGDGTNYMSNMHMLPVFGKPLPESEIDFKFPDDDLFMHLNGMEMDHLEVKLKSISFGCSNLLSDRIKGI